MDREKPSSTLWQILTEEIRSDQLAQLRQGLPWLQRQMPGLLKVPPVLNFIPDANCVLSEMDYLCRRQQKPGRTALQEVVDAGAARLFAPIDLDSEVIENIPDLARQTGFPPEAYFAAWPEYRKRIHFFRLPTRGTVTLSDPDDVYLFDAIGVVGADAIISDDGVVLGKGRAVKPTMIHRRLRRLTRDEAVRRTLALQGIMLLLLAGKGVEGLVRLCIRRPMVALPALLGSAGILYLVDRWQMRASGRSVVREFWNAFRDDSASFLESLGDLTRSAQATMADVEGELGERAPRTLDQFIAAATIAAASPVSEKELIDTIHVDGYDAWARDRIDGETLDEWNAHCWKAFVTNVHEQLRYHPHVVQTEHGWTSRLLPMSEPSSAASTGAAPGIRTSPGATTKTGSASRPSAARPARPSDRSRGAGKPPPPARSRRRSR